MADGQVAGCVALKHLTEGVAELKRLYVRPAYRNQGVGRQLALTVVDTARQSGFRAVRLDTLPSMKEALSLYRSLGFQSVRSEGRCACAEASIDMELRLLPE
jgi:ribosomal protein S18 acetylase RimI-like enzyme